MEATSAAPTGSSEPQPGPRTRLCSLEDKTPGPMAPRQPGTGDRQPHVPEVAARTEAPPGATQGPGPSPASHPRAPPKKPRCPRVQLTPARTPSLKSFQPDTMGGLPAQAGQLDSSDYQGDGGGRGYPRWPWLPPSGLESWHQPCPQPGDAGGQKTAELREDHGASTGPQGQTPPAPSPRTGHLYPRRDSRESSSSTPGDHLGARVAHFGGLWRAGERGPLGSGAGPRSLSEQVEKNRLLLREMLRGGGAATLKPGPPSCDRAAPGRPAGDMDGDLEGTRTCGSPPEPTSRPGQDRLPPPQARVKARTRPLRASHDIMPTLTPDRSLTPATPPRPWAQVSTDPPWTSAARPHPPPAGQLLLSTSHCKDRRPGGRTETDPHGPEPPLAPESPSHGGPQAVASGGLSAEPGCSPEADGAPQQSGATSGQPTTPRQAQGDPAGPSPPTATPWDRSRRSGGRGGFTPGLGLKKIFSALGQVTRPLAGRTRSHSVEQLRTPTPAPGTPEARRAPSLQFLHLVSRSPQRGKSASFHSLQALLSGRGDRASLYRVQEPAGDSSAGRAPHSTPPRRALSVEDVGAPIQARTVGRVVAAFPDGTSQLQLQCSPGGTFGFCVAAGSGRRDSGLYVRAMADVGTAKLYSGLLAVGDEILEVDGAKVAALGTAHVQELLARADSVSLRVLRQRPAPR